MPMIQGVKSLFAVATLSLTLAACSGDNVGDVSLGLLTTKDIKIQTFEDPKIPGVTCHISHVKADLSLADPSDMGISCRQTGPISAEEIADIDRSKSGEVVFKASKSILFKTLKIRRIYDASAQTLIYLSYSTKELEGSYKHSMSTVPLYGTEAWQQPDS
ncbi:CreA family protein [Thaumasiovibrio subtropicus]|uniref:CreA family protein n=1 Tax=Thaumasiovibrio subtropicus TaxID=1891207 RepID=UPI000B34FC65|nr:CreA family protein [Thaumasiovibrio subtropicus]